MIDIHSHILWGLDDGPRGIGDSLAMLRLAAKYGTTDIVATPHSSPKFIFQPELVKDRIVELAAVSGNVPRIHRGCDFHLSFENVQDALALPAKYTINGLNYLLLEFAEAFIPHSTDDVLRQFTMLGVVPVITHPERNPLLQDNVGRLEKWIGLGCIVQVTAQSLEGVFGTKALHSAWRLLRKGFVHVIASDAHDVEHRPPRLDAARHMLTRKIGAEAAGLLLIKNPTAILAGEAVRNVVITKKWYPSRWLTKSAKIR